MCHLEGNWSWKDINGIEELSDICDNHLSKESVKNIVKPKFASNIEAFLDFLSI